MKLEELKRIAEAATPGRWKVDVLHLRQPYDHNQDGTEADNTFASTFNPDLVLKLLAVVKAAKEYRYQQERPYIDFTETGLSAAYEALIETLDALEK